jgi:aminoglycoside phosphotransferase (APT) family kinase protein
VATQAEELTEVAADEPLLNLPLLLPFLREKLQLDGTVTFRRFRGGHANINFMISDSGRTIVLRRPPPGPLPPRAHDMGREFRVLELLHPVFGLAPRGYMFCDDRSIIGTSFLVMEHRAGIVIRDGAQLQNGAAHNRRIGDMIIDVLADLHQLDPAPLIAARLGNPDGFAGRQVAGWTKRWQAARSADDSAIDAIAIWLQDHVPRAGRAAVLHNDFKLDNIIMSAGDLAVPAAVVDWDMCTVGDPLFDLGLLLAYWGEAKDGPDWIKAASMPTFLPGFPTRQEASERYAARTGIDLTALEWYVIFAAFRIIVALQQIFRRYAAGQSHDERFAIFGERIGLMTRKAARLIELARA